ncbi:MAG: nuclear transport factor 2 family protein [Cytophagaceae bacterium]|nr:nuclear transport factor 2 family protein [Cytophagaceae bacterium]
MHPNEALLTRFYQAFAQRDFATMAACYHPDATFNDPVFTLKGREIAAMWHMLCLNAEDFSASFSHVEADDQRGSTRWEAHYRFSRTNRSVHNRIRATFEFREGKIITHRDQFSFWRWAAMALGGVGYLLGGTAFMQRRVQTNARTSLDKFIAQHPEYEKKI